MIINIINSLLTTAVLLLVIIVFRYRNKSIAIEKKLISILERNSKLNIFMEYVSDKLCKYSFEENIYNGLAERISEILDSDGVCIYGVKENKYLVPIGFFGDYPAINIARKFILSKPRFFTDSLKHDSIEVGDGIIGKVGLNKIPIALDIKANQKELAEINRVTNTTSIMAAPLAISGQLVGVIGVVMNAPKKKAFDYQQQAILNALSKIIAIIYQIISSFSLTATRNRIDQEIEITRLLQTSLLPKEPPQWKPFEICAFTRSAKEVSGDFYDFVEIDSNRLLVVLGDASGKGIPACMVMAMTRSFIRANAENFTTLEDMMCELNNNLYRDSSEGRFTTLACCLLDKRENLVEFARAGHTDLMIFSSKQKIRKISPHGAALGLLPNEMTGKYDSFSFSFKPYYSMMLFSDGIIEAINKDNEEFGTNNLEKAFYECCLKKSSPVKAIDKILNSLDKFTAESEQFDDQTIVIISHEQAFF